ncbi:MAG: PorV/PorQ family protein [Flavobacteriales bacterium]|nr:PorV/PorQ family protein [Flavobacteriales bacterium]
MRHIFSLVILFGVFFITEVKAQLIPNFGGQRAGLSTLSFLKNDMNPRSTAMSGASVAIDPDSYAAFSNPAGAADLETFNASLSNYSLGAGVQQSFVSALIPRKGNLSTIGVSLNMLNSGAMDVRTEFQPEGTGEKFYVTNLAAGVTYAQQLSDMFSAGITVKYIYEQIDSYTNSTVAADVSFLYKTDYKDLNFAVMIQNFGGSSSIDGDDLPSDFNRSITVESDNYSVPTVFSLGASVIPWKQEKQSLLVSVQLNHPTDNAENYRIGLEYEYLKLLYLRAGYKLNVNSQPYPTFGFGLRHRVGGHPVFLNYAANPTEFLGVLHTVGVAFRINKMDRSNGQ